MTFLDLVRKEGFLRLWRGAPAMFAACIPTHAAYFSAFEAAKQALGADGPGHHPLAAGAAGVVATALHDAILTPMDLVKQRLQLGYYRGALHCLATVARTEGVAALYRSYPTTLVMNMPYAAVAMAANESLRKVLTPDGQQPGLLTFLLSGAGAGALAAAATCPLDVVKTRLQTATLMTWGEAAAAAAPSTVAAVSSVSAAATSSLGAVATSGSSMSSSSSCALPACARAPICAGVASSPAEPASVAAPVAASAGVQPPPVRGSSRGLLGGLIGSGSASRPQQQPGGALGVALLYTAPAGRIGLGSAAASALPRPLVGAVAAARQLYAEGGARAFLRGVQARMAAHTPAMAVSWATYESIKRLLLSGTVARRGERDGSS